MLLDRLKFGWIIEECNFNIPTVLKGGGRHYYRRGEINSITFWSIVEKALGIVDVTFVGFVWNFLIINYFSI